MHAPESVPLSSAGCVSKAGLSLGQGDTKGQMGTGGVVQEMGALQSEGESSTGTSLNRLRSQM